MIQVNTHEAKGRNEKPMARPAPLEPSPDPLKQHPKLMAVKIHGDPKAPLDEEDWPSELR